MEGCSRIVYGAGVARPRPALASLARRTSLAVGSRTRLTQGARVAFNPARRIQSRQTLTHRRVMAVLAELPGAWSLGKVHR